MPCSIDEASLLLPAPPPAATGGGARTLQPFDISTNSQGKKAFLFFPLSP